MIQVLPYRPEWPQEFALFGARLRDALGALAVRIDHIGSTSVPGLAAKDVIDVQITVRALEPSIEHTLRSAGYIRLEDIWRDHVPPGAPEDEAQWVKWIFKQPDGQRRINVHIRVAGRLNQRYPLLFRDYLRAHPPVSQAYAQIKQALARLHPDDVEAYYDVKDPVCDIIMDGAEEWAAATHWEQGPTDC